MLYTLSCAALSLALSPAGNSPANRNTQLSVSQLTKPADPKTTSRPLEVRPYEDLARHLAPLPSSAPDPQTDRYRAITLNSLDDVVERHPPLAPYLEDIRLAGLVFPFKASPYVVDELIDWSSSDLSADPTFRLVFPTMAMLSEEHREMLLDAAADPLRLKEMVETIRGELNPHPAGQKELNAPKEEELTGVQHKYSETVLFFAAAAQTCHAYCTYCFRWAQFVGDADLRFAQSDASSLFDYLDNHREVTDVLFTGGDPMFMKTSMLKTYLDPFRDPNFLPHVTNLRFGTRALTFWPQRFTTDADADSLMELLREVGETREIAVMAHIGHHRELSTPKVREAIARIQDEAGANIRSQSPVMRGINDDPMVWQEKWKQEVALGIIPYYMFVARDTGAQEFFGVPLARAHKIYSDAIRGTSGLCRTARGPSMSATPGKIETLGVEMVGGVKAFVMRFLQCRNAEWVGRVFFAKYDPEAIWFDELEPLDGMELPWDDKGLPKEMVF